MVVRHVVLKSYTNKAEDKDQRQKEQALFSHVDLILIPFKHKFMVLNSLCVNDVYFCLTFFEVCH